MRLALENGVVGHLIMRYTDEKQTVLRLGFVIVDDSKMIRKLLRNILEAEGYCVVAEASNGLEAIDAYKKYHPDILSLDVTMPQMDGIEALEKIMEYDSHARVIMVTAAGQQQKVISALKLGAEKFIMKPFLKEDVIRGFEK